MNPIIRAARLEDAAALAALGRGTFIDTYAEFNTPQDMALHLQTRYTAMQQAKEIADPTMLTLVAESDDGLVAFTQCHAGPHPACVAAQQPVPQQPWEVLRFYVDRRWHGRGLAAQLMHAAVQAMHDKNADTVWLGVWSRNPRAQAFYRKMGFDRIGATTFTLGTDVQTDDVMYRRLDGVPGVD